MSLLNSTKAKRFFRRFDGVFQQNPVFVLGLGIPFAVCATTSLRHAAIVSIAMVCTGVPVSLLASLLGRHIPKWLRTTVYALVSALLLIPVRTYLQNYFQPATLEALGIYFSLMSVNTVIFYLGQSNRVVQEKPWWAVVIGLCASLGFSLALFLIAFFRELFGTGSIWGYPVELVPVKLSGLLMPFAGFFVLGFLGAFWQFAARAGNLLAEHRRSRKAKQKASPKEPRPAAEREE